MQLQLLLYCSITDNETSSHGPTKVVEAEAAREKGRGSTSKLGSPEMRRRVRYIHMYNRIQCAH